MNPRVNPNISLSGIGRRGRSIWCATFVFCSSQQLDFAAPKPQETINSHCVRAEFIDDYRLLVAVTSWITTPQLWDTAIAAQAGSSSSVEFGLGPDYTIDAGLGNPFYFNLGSSHDAPFHEDASRQLVGIRVVSRSRSRRGSTLLVIRYGDLVKLTSQKKTWVKWETWRNLITPIEFEPDVQEFGLLRSHLLATCKDLKDSATLLRVYDFTVRSRRQQGREKAVSDCLPPYTLREFLLGTGVGPLSEFLFTEDTVLASAVSALLTWVIRDLTYVIHRVRWMEPHCYCCGRCRDGRRRPTHTPS